MKLSDSDYIRALKNQYGCFANLPEVKDHDERLDKIANNYDELLKHLNEFIIAYDLKDHKSMIGLQIDKARTYIATIEDISHEQSICRRGQDHG